MKEVRPGIVMVRRTKKNKVEQLKQDMITEKAALEIEIAAKHSESEKTIDELHGLADGVRDYIEVLKERGIDVNYIRDNAEQIKNIFFAVLELLENGNKGFEETISDNDKETREDDSDSPAAASHVRCE